MSNERIITLRMSEADHNILTMEALNCQVSIQRLCMEGVKRIVSVSRGDHFIDVPAANHLTNLARDAIRKDISRDYKNRDPETRSIFAPPEPASPTYKGSLAGVR